MNLREIALLLGIAVLWVGALYVVFQLLLFGILELVVFLKERKRKR